MGLKWISSFIGHKWLAGCMAQTQLRNGATEPPYCDCDRRHPVARGSSERHSSPIGCGRGMTGGLPEAR
ncbi:hypothetical protein RchiOBHm_Chr3g0486291 [Rosa chinensis]|uniref:Uncharacterized protein n=1 Tax=Rosa chinensis TaxID=74649 RepID=A0A2P6RF75_ROSCH|nr:hypothetical protein RchiOBHm_Chr3g0486291 [Rosa chinensis]